MPDITFEQWSAAIKLCDMWQFYDLKKNVVAHISTLLDQLTPLELYRVSETCNVPEWRLPVFAKLCARSETFSEEEIDELVVADGFK